jgi:hypothetical protein
VTEDEESWLGWVVDYAIRVARPPWRWYHTRDSRRSVPGFPDLVLVRPPRLLFVELKTERGKLTADQVAWLEDLEMVSATFVGRAWDPPADPLPPPVEVYVWRPSDRPEIERILR